jgi:hypothetical protein
MIPRFALIDIEKRNEFEKELQLPYGYGSVNIFDNFDDALAELKEYPTVYNGCSIERIDEDGREVVFIESNYE